MTTCRMVAEPCVKRVCETICETVTEPCVKIVPETVCEMQTVQCVRKVPYTTCRQVCRDQDDLLPGHRPPPGDRVQDGLRAADGLQAGAGRGLREGPGGRPLPAGGRPVGPERGRLEPVSGHDAALRPCDSAPARQPDVHQPDNVAARSLTGKRPRIARFRGRFPFDFVGYPAASRVDLAPCDHPVEAGPETARRPGRGG